MRSSAKQLLRTERQTARRPGKRDPGPIAWGGKLRVSNIEEKKENFKKKLSGTRRSERYFFLDRRLQGKGANWLERQGQKRRLDIQRKEEEKAVRHEGFVGSFSERRALQMIAGKTKIGPRNKWRKKRKLIEAVICTRGGKTVSLIQAHAQVPSQERRSSARQKRRHAQAGKGGDMKQGLRVLRT